VDGRPHLAQARPVIAARKPLFVDKPMAANVANAIEIFRLAQQAGVLCWSSSAFRFGEGVAGARENAALGQIVGCDTFGSSSWTDFHPDLYLYGIHPVEALYTVLGTGCETVRRIKTDATDMVVGTWSDGRLGTFRDLRGGKSGSPALIYGTEGMVTGKSAGYQPLIQQIVKSFKTGQAPVPAEETIEILAFMSAADVSRDRGGAPVSVPALIAEARGK
jgi:predicted dehydrogenase